MPAVEGRISCCTCENSLFSILTSGPGVGVLVMRNSLGLGFVREMGSCAMRRDAD